MRSRKPASLAGVTVRTIRHYHQIDLLAEPPRDANGYRRYGVQHLVRLLRIWAPVCTRPHLWPRCRSCWRAQTSIVLTCLTSSMSARLGDFRNIYGRSAVPSPN